MKVKINLEQIKNIKNEAIIINTECFQIIQNLFSN